MPVGAVLPGGSRICVAHGLSVSLDLEQWVDVVFAEGPQRQSRRFDRRCRYGVSAHGAGPNPPTEAWASSLSAGDVLLQVAQELDRRVDLGFADGDAFDVHAERQAFSSRIVPDLGQDAAAELEPRGERDRRAAQRV